MSIEIDLFNLLLVILLGLLIYILFENMKMGGVKEDKTIYVERTYPSDYWYRSTWWPWNWATGPWHGNSGSVWFGPGKCSGWHCKDEHRPTHPHPTPIMVTQTNNVGPSPSPLQEAPQIPIQDVVIPPTGPEDTQVALAPTPQTIAPTTEMTPMPSMPSMPMPSMPMPSMPMPTEQSMPSMSMPTMPSEQSMPSMPTEPSTPAI